jgi:hypothetical protein
MKAILTVLLFVIVWCFVGHFHPSVSLSMTALLLPITFFVSKKIFGKSLNRFIYSVFSFGIILVNDYLFRLFGGGIYDDAARGLCDISFYLTLLISTIFLMILQIQNSERGKSKIYGGLFVLAIASITLFIFKNIVTYR